MAVCDFDTRFTFVVNGWPGSVHDTRILMDTLVTYKDQFPHAPEDMLSCMHKRLFVLVYKLSIILTHC